MNTKTPECGSSDPNAHGVKIELSSEQSLLLSFDQFAFAELKTEGKQQPVIHEIVVTLRSKTRTNVLTIPWNREG